MSGGGPRIRDRSCEHDGDLIATLEQRVARLQAERDRLREQLKVAHEGIDALQAGHAAPGIPPKKSLAAGLLDDARAAFHWFRARVLGYVRCQGCGDTIREEKAHAAGWRWCTVTDGEAVWLCGDCQEDSERDAWRWM